MACSFVSTLVENCVGREAQRLQRFCKGGHRVVGREAEELFVWLPLRRKRPRQGADEREVDRVHDDRIVPRPRPRILADLGAEHQKRYVVKR